MNYGWETAEIKPIDRQAIGTEGQSHPSPWAPPVDLLLPSAVCKLLLQVFKNISFLYKITFPNAPNKLMYYKYECKYLEVNPKSHICKT